MNVLQCDMTTTTVSYLNQPIRNDFTISSIFDLLQDDDLQQTIVTFSERLDEMLGGGVPLAKITEIVGVPGSGKTQVCLQLAVDVQIPQCLGGVGGECLFIDTEHSFSLERFKQIATAALEHCHHISDNSEESKKALKSFTLESALAGLHYLHCMDATHLIAIVETLDDILQERNVKLIVIDSIAFPMRVGLSDHSLRTRVLSGLAQKLVQIAVTKKIAVVLTNHMTTKLNKDRSVGRIVPALGESWGHVSSTRVMLDERSADGVRTARLVKSPSRPVNSVPFQITPDGVRDVMTNNECDIPTNDDVVTDSQLVRLDLNENLQRDRHYTSDTIGHIGDDADNVICDANASICDVSRKVSLRTEAGLPPTKRARLEPEKP